MDFTQSETTFYAAIFVASAIACVARIFRDNERIDLPTIFGRCLAGGVLSFGTIGIWIGRNPDTAGGAYYWMAIAALIGYCSRDVQDQILNRIVNWVLKKFGPIEPDHDNDK